MAEINTTQTSKRGLARNLKVDMTPMVDLGFLLITFFIFSTTLDTPKTLKLVVPKEDGPNTLSGESNTLTVLLTEPGKAVCYEGIAGDKPAMPVEMKGENLRALIIAKQKALKQLQGSDERLLVIIKPGEQSNYKQLMAVLDEMAICEVGKHVMAEMDMADRSLLAINGL